MTISKTARFRVPASDVPAAVDAIRVFVQAIEDDEAGTKLYATFRRGDDPVEFLHVMIFADESAETAHRTSAAVGRFTDSLYPITLEGVAFDDWQLIATTSVR